MFGGWMVGVPEIIASALVLFEFDIREQRVEIGDFVDTSYKNVVSNFNTSLFQILVL